MNERTERIEVGIASHLVRIIMPRPVDREKRLRLVRSLVKPASHRIRNDTVARAVDD